MVGANFVNNTFTGDGSQTAFTTTVEAGSKNNAQVYIDGVYQLKSSFSVSANTLTFTEAPPLNSQIEVIIGNAIDNLDGDSGNVNYNQGGTGAQTRTVESKLQDIVSVKDFGATGDGVTDDTAAIQNALNTLSSGGSIYLENGKTYLLSSMGKSGLTLSANTVFDLNGSTLKFTGTGEVGNLVPSDNCVIKNGTVWSAGSGVPGPNDQVPIRIGQFSTGASVSNVTLENLVINQDSNTTNAIAVYSDSNKIRIRDIHFEDNTNSIGFCIMVHWGNNDAVQAAGAPTLGVSKHPYQVNIENISVGDWGSSTSPAADGGVVAISAGYDVEVSNVVVENCKSGFQVTAGDVSSDYAATAIAPLILKNIRLSNSRFSAITATGARINGSPATVAYGAITNLDTPVIIDGNFFVGENASGAETAIYLSGYNNRTVIKNNQITSLDGNAIGLLDTANGIVIANNYIKDIDRSGIYTTTSEDANRIVVRDNYIANCNIDNIGLSAESVHIAVSGDDWIIEGNEFGVSGDNSNAAVYLLSTANRVSIRKNIYVSPVSTSAISDANLNKEHEYDLADTFTPTAPGSSGGSAGLSTAQGYYVRTARKVKCTFYMVFDGTGSPTGNLRIGNIPYRTANLTNYFETAVISFSGIDLTAGYTQLVARANPDDSTFRILQCGDNVGAIDLPVTAISSGDSISLTLEYTPT